MVENLFSNSKLQKTKKREKSYVFSVLLVLMFITPSVISASTLQQKIADSEQQSNVIYISGNTTIFGADNNSEIKVVATKTGTNPSTNRIEKDKPSTNSISAQLEIKNSKDLEISKNLEKKAKEIVKISFINTSSTNSNFASNSSAISKEAVLSSNFYSQYKFSKEISKDKANSYACKSSKKKLKFYSTLSFLQFGKYRNSSLRAPPFNY